MFKQHARVWWLRLSCFACLVVCRRRSFSATLACAVWDAVRCVRGVMIVHVQYRELASRLVSNSVGSTGNMPRQADLDSFALSLVPAKLLNSPRPSADMDM